MTTTTPELETTPAPLDGLDEFLSSFASFEVPEFITIEVTVRNSGRAGLRVEYIYEIDPALDGEERILDIIWDHMAPIDKTGVPHTLSLREVPFVLADQGYQIVGKYAKRRISDDMTLLTVKAKRNLNWDFEGEWN